MYSLADTKPVENPNKGTSINCDGASIYANKQRRQRQIDWWIDTSEEGQKKWKASLPHPGK